MTRPMNLRLQPMLHVDAMAPAVAFLEALGGRLLYGSRDNDWSLLDVGGSELSLLAHPANPADGDERVELNFVCSGSLDDIEARLREEGVDIVQGTSDEAFGRQLKLRTPDGLLVKINDIERDLIADQ